MQNLTLEDSMFRHLNSNWLISQSREQNPNTSTSICLTPSTVVILNSWLNIWVFCVLKVEPKMKALQYNETS